MKAKKSSSETKHKDSKKVLAATGKYKGTCTFCGKIGHKATDCYTRKNKEKTQEDRKNNDKLKNAQKGEWSKEKVQLHRTTTASFVRNQDTSHKIAGRRRPRPQMQPKRLPSWPQP